MASSRFEDSNYAKKLFRLSSLFYGAMRRLSFFLIRVDNDSRGGIQLFDYRMGALIDTVDNHEGSVCSHSIAFLLLKRVLLQIMYILFNLKLGREANTILALQASWTWPEV
uniref:Uncharacterized protein n=1 Tax=Brassica oleracea TaxID=3712 RepID=A0A3P6F0S7_BRAOL|nr:unnamed protein product [Brassica oleracea]